MLLMTIGTVGICVFGVIYLIGHTIESVKTYLPKKNKVKTEEIEDIPTQEPEPEVKETENE